MTIVVTVHASSKIQKVEARDDGSIHVYTHKSPVNGDANREVIKILSKHYRIPKSRILLIRGEKSKIKTFELS